MGFTSFINRTGGFMHSFSLKLLGNKSCPDAQVDFEAHDAGMALLILQKDADCRSAVLSREERPICTIHRTGKGGAIWEVGPPPPANS